MPSYTLPCHMTHLNSLLIVSDQNVSRWKNTYKTPHNKQTSQTKYTTPYCILNMDTQILLANRNSCANDTIVFIGNVYIHWLILNSCYYNVYML